MHAHAARSPNFLAAVAIANQSMSASGEACFRCHAPAAWLEGRVVGHPDGSAMTSTDFQIGVSCHICHRMVNPIPSTTPKGSSPPAEDGPILAALGSNLPTSYGEAQIVIDPVDRRRGPFNLDADWTPDGWPGFHEYIESVFHEQAHLCGTCHDVSNPALSRQPNGTYSVNGHNQAHPTGNPADMFPEQRTFSEWLNSAYANGGVDSKGRFGGNNPVVAECQNCHMPDGTGTACNPDFGGPIRDDVPQHQFSGVNVYGLRAVQYLYGPSEDYYFDQAIEAGKADVLSMLQRATDETLTQQGAELRVRITNYCGHKLFTGYPEGRRAWINVQYLNASNQLIAERGAYNAATATLNSADTKVYEVKHGLDAAMATLTGLAAGPSFNLILNNVVLQDNRIPPLGFTNAAFTAIQSPPIGATYADGQNWDDTPYFIPAGAASARVRFYHQTITREYAEFLRDSNSSNDAGITAYNTWLALDKAPPDLMDDETIALAAYVPGDVNGDGHVNTFDLAIVLSNFGFSGRSPTRGDINGDGIVNTFDLALVLSHFGQ